MSQPPKTRSFNSPRGTNFLICGDLPSVRFPNRIAPTCVSEPTGCDLPGRTSSTPAMNVVLTAPIPGSNTPNFPLAGSIFPGLSIPLLLLRNATHNAQCDAVMASQDECNQTRTNQ